MENYRSDRVSLHYLCDLPPRDAEALIGETVARVEGQESTLTLVFQSGVKLIVSGYRWADSPLRVEVDDREKADAEQE